MSFHPFVVQCQTCGSRLRVTEPGIIGTIAACPKCNSMVQIQRPPGVGDAPHVAVGQSDVDSQAITEEGIAVGHQGANPQNLSDPHSADQHDPQVAPESVSDPQRFAGSSAVDAPTPPPLDAAPWQSERTRRTRQIALVVALSLSGFLTAGVVFSWFVRSWNEQSAPTQRQMASAEGDASSDTSDAAVDPETAGDPSSVSADTDATEDPGNENPDSPDPDTSDPPSADPVQEETTEDSGGDHTTENALAATEPNDPIPSDLIPSSPIIPDPAADDPGDDEESSMQQLPPELEKYTQFLLDQGVTEQPTLKAPPTMDEVQVVEAADEEDDLPLPGRAKELNLKADLAFRVALDYKGYPLTDLMLLISQTVGVPIQIDWVSFDLAGIDIDQIVAVQKGWRPAGELLEATAASMGAEIREQKSVVVFTLSDERFGESLTAITSLDGFGDQRDSAGDVLKDFLRDDEAAAGELQFGQSREGKQLAALAVEALRRMRGIDPVVDDNRLQRWAHPSETEFSGWRRLQGGDAGEPLDTPITLAGFLRRVSKLNGATCIVNWYDVTRRGAAPEYLVFPHVKVDAATTVDQTLEPLSLQARQVDSKHWWVGSEATYDRLPVVVWTPKLGQSREAFTTRMDAIMAGASRDEYRLTVDDQSDRALLLLPRYIVRQLPKIAPAIAAR